MPVRAEESRRVAIIGGGPAGLIAAEVLAQAGVDVMAYEKMRSVGRKFLLAGRGGLNITHSEPLEAVLERYGQARESLEPALRLFSPTDLQEWCAGLGEPTFVGSSGRVFPESFRATPLLRSWLRRLEGLGVTIETGHRWAGWETDGSLRIEAEGTVRTVAVDATLFALGGASWPRVGSDGAWVDSLVNATIDGGIDGGITVNELQAANCGIAVSWSDVIREKFGGVPIKNTVFSVVGAEERVRGDAVVTEAGLEGGPIYALGPAIRHELDRRRLGESAHTHVHLDLHPDQSVEQLTERLSKRRAKASTTSWLQSASIAPVSVALSREATQNQLPSDPAAMAELLKDIVLPVAAMAPLDRAISTAGGVAWSELDENYMLRRMPGMFVAGEMLDWEAPTGGYLLQACFSTGVAAAKGVLGWLD